MQNGWTIHPRYLVQYSSTIDIECLTDNSVYLNKYHDEFVNKTGDEYILPVVDLDRLRKTALHQIQKRFTKDELTNCTQNVNSFEIITKKISP